MRQLFKKERNSSIGVPSTPLTSSGRRREDHQIPAFSFLAVWRSPRQSWWSPAGAASCALP